MWGDVSCRCPDPPIPSADEHKLVARKQEEIHSRASAVMGIDVIHLHEGGGGGQGYFEGARGTYIPYEGEGMCPNMWSLHSGTASWVLPLPQM